MIHISKADADDWLRSRCAIIEALEKAGLCLWSNAEGFWIAPAPAVPVVWQQTSADGEPLWDYDNFLSTPEHNFLSTPEHFDYSRPLYANPVQATPAPADDVRAALADLVGLEDMRKRLKGLHERGHGTDYDQYQKALPLAWEAARMALKGKT